MTVLQALFLGILQGITEFLPISSSGHLVVAESFLHLQFPASELQGFDVLLHAGSALAILYCYRDIWFRIVRTGLQKGATENRLVVLLIVATIPAAIIGVLFEEMIASYFRSTYAVAFAFLATAAVLVAGERMRGDAKYTDMSFAKAVIVGLGQALALIPGLSRSGLTASTGRFMGLSRTQALDFSFLMALPIIAGATLLTCIDIASGSVALPEFSVSFIGVVTSFFASLLAIYTIRTMVLRYSLGWFSLYLITLSLFLLSAV